jgi:hypothetical protein
LGIGCVKAGAVLRKYEHCGVMFVNFEWFGFFAVIVIASKNRLGQKQA